MGSSVVPNMKGEKMYLVATLLSQIIYLVQAKKKYGQDCASTLCPLVTCPNGSVPPPSPGQCCPDLSRCKQNCRLVKCDQTIKCPDGSPAPVPLFGCCPDSSLCKPHCKGVVCLTVLVLCPDGSPAPVPEDGCCQDKSLCNPKPDCRTVRCGVARCSDGSLAPVPDDVCCPDASLCTPKCGADCPPFLPPVCSDGSTPPTPPGSCCPDPALCPIPPCVANCSCVTCLRCPEEPSRCDDGTVAPRGKGCCACPSKSLCK